MKGLSELTQELRGIEQDKKIADSLTLNSKKNFLELLNKREDEIKVEINRILYQIKND